jgi:hypothetical protein
MNQQDIEKICAGCPESMDNHTYQRLLDMALTDLRDALAERHLYMYSPNYRDSREFGRKMGRPFSIVYDPIMRHMHPHSAVVILNNITPSKAQAEKIEIFKDHLSKRNQSPQIWTIGVWK